MVHFRPTSLANVTLEFTEDEPCVTIEIPATAVALVVSDDSGDSEDLLCAVA